MKFAYQNIWLAAGFLSMAACGSNTATNPSTKARDQGAASGNATGTSGSDATAGSTSSGSTASTNGDAKGSTSGSVQSGANSRVGTIVGTGDTSSTTGTVSGSANAGSWFKPTADMTWQWQLTGTINTAYDVKVYDIDLFDAPDATIAALKAKGKKVICYYSAGSSEDWRPDYSTIKAATMGNGLDGWPGEKWLDIRSDNAMELSRGRLDMAVKKGCDGVEPDNVDGYANKTGFPLTAADQLKFLKALADEAHKRGLAVALKNDVDQVKDLAATFDFAVNEQCHEYNECGNYTAFTGLNKPVFNAEYKDSSTLCTKAKSENLRTLVLPLDLNDKSRKSCDS